MDEEGVAKVFVSPLALATAPLCFCLGQRAVGLPPRLRPFGRQPKTEISFGLCYNNDATTIKNGRSALHALCSAPRALRIATPLLVVGLRSLLLRANTPRAPVASVEGR